MPLNHQRLTYNVGCIGFRNITILVKHNGVRDICVITFNLDFPLQSKFIPQNKANT